MSIAALRGDRLSVGIYPLLWWLHVILHATNDGVNMMRPINLLSPLNSDLVK